MEKKNKFSKRKRRIASGIVSYILVFAMILTNIQPALSTVYAAENETELSSEVQTETEQADASAVAEESDEAQAADEASKPSETQESGETAKPSEAETTEPAAPSETQASSETAKPSETETTEPAEPSETETTKPSETEEATETVKPSETEETTETAKPSETEETTETAKPSETEETTETAKPSETEETTETVETMTETETATETEIETETETEIETETEQITVDAEEAVTVKAHFKNLHGWEEVAIHHWGGGLPGTEWPGDAVTEKDEDGNFVVELTGVSKAEELGIIFNNNNNGAQTGDIKIPASEFTADTYELWVWVDDTGATGWNTEPVSPHIEKNTVSFRYMNNSAETVLIAGSMNGWASDADSENAIKMVKGEDGIFTYTTKLQRGDYEYKFVILGGEKPQWTIDPNNDNRNNGNSALSIKTLLSPEIKEYTATFYHESDVETVLVAGSMNGWNENPESPDAAVMTRNEDGLLTYTFDGLLPGDYTYKFIEIVDGSKNWIADPNNDLMADDGYGGKNSLFTIGEDSSKVYEYTIHYYNPAVAEPVLEEPDILIWNGNASSGSGKPYLFEEMLDDEENGIQWLTLNVKVPYKKIGMNGRPKAGKTKKDADRTYAITSGEDTAELWYVYGKGIYDKKPAFGRVEEVKASLSSESMNYTQNNVLSLELSGKDGVAVTGRIREAYVDASALGMSSKMYIDPELLAVTLSVRESVAAGTYTLPVTVRDFYNTEIETSVDVEVVSKNGDSFDWDEAVIYFMVTDRFYDGNSGNNDANGADTYGDNDGL